MFGTKLPCLKALGERIAAKHPAIQTAAIQMRIALVDRFNALGTTGIIRMA